MNPELAKLIYECVRFAYWGAEQGMMPAESEQAVCPEDFFYDYSCATNDTEWELIAEKVRTLLTEKPKSLPGAKYAVLPDGHIVILHPKIPPHIWDGEKMVPIQLSDRHFGQTVSFEPRIITAHPHPEAEYPKPQSES